MNTLLAEHERNYINSNKSWYTDEEYSNSGWTIWDMSSGGKRMITIQRRVYFTEENDFSPIVKPDRFLDEESTEWFPLNNVRDYYYNK